MNRNAPCPCGSGRRFKHCCGANAQTLLPRPGIPPTGRAETPANEQLLSDVQALIARLRRGADVERDMASFRVAVEMNIEAICRSFNTRQLVSVCDTYADYGDPLEQRNALLVSLLVNGEKISQSYLLWRLNYAAPFAVPDAHVPVRAALWDGMDSFHLDIGDVTNNLFRRLGSLIKGSAHIHHIYEAVIQRLADHPTILGTLNRRHRHVFETDTRWRRGPAYDRFRASGELPAWKTDE